METVQYILPTFWAAYLFNDDPSHMTDEEIAACDQWMHNRDLPAPSDIQEAGFVCFHDAFTVALAADCSTYTFLLPAKVTP